MNLFERAYLKFTNVAPARLATRLDLMRSSYFADPPLNGQRERQRIVRELARAVDFDEVVETGTFRGATTLFFSNLLGCPVHSAELLQRYYGFAEVRCAADPNTRLWHGDSRELLRRLAPEIDDHSTLFYLDAHWETDVPRFEELEIIARRERAVVVIDDFQVPGDPGYEFTHYGGAPLNLDYLPELPGWWRFFPAAPSSEETGAKRGCIVLASAALTEPVGRLGTLRVAA
jgi:predicted O-methyltransferase YrrM